jgi:hypothetical protein
VARTDPLTEAIKREGRQVGLRTARRDRQRIAELVKARSRRLWLCHDAEHHPAMRAVKKDNVCCPLAGHLYSLRQAGNGRLLAIDLINSVAAPRAREELSHRATVPL